MANPDKTELFTTRMVFMGHMLTDEGIHPTEEKVRAIQEAREPETPTEVRSFLGLVNYCGRYIPDMATVAEPLRRLTKKDENFVFGPEQRNAFRELKKRLGSSQVLGYYDPNAKTKIIADASPVGLGAVLVQEQEGKTRVIRYAARSLTSVERRYSQTEKEALGLVWACETFHPYVYGLEFELVTDHKPLEVIYSPSSRPCARIERWVLRMQAYKFRIVHIAGKSNIADPLSRLVRTRTEADNRTVDKVDSYDMGCSTEEYIRWIAINATPGTLTAREIERVQWTRS